MSRQPKTIPSTPATRATQPNRNTAGRERSRRSLSSDDVPLSLAVEVRQAKLDHARQLLKDSRYPSEEVIESVAKLLARHWRRLSKASGRPED